MNGWWLSRCADFCHFHVQWQAPYEWFHSVDSGEFHSEQIVRAAVGPARHCSSSQCRHEGECTCLFLKMQLARQEFHFSNLKPAHLNINENNCFSFCLVQRRLQGMNTYFWNLIWGREREKHYRGFPFMEKKKKKINVTNKLFLKLFMLLNQLIIIISDSELLVTEAWSLVVTIVSFFFLHINASLCTMILTHTEFVKFISYYPHPLPYHKIY